MTVVAAPPETGLTFSGTGMTFPDGTVALTGVNLTVGPGEFVAVVGPSGCGKSTLLRLASGLTKATGGNIAVDRNSLGYVFQDATLLPWRTVKANVELFAELHKIGKPERTTLAAEAIKLVGLEGFEKKLPLQLSGGMKMRVSLARSLTMRPRVFLFDEPFGALDEITRERLQSELLRLYALEKFAALFITHSITEAVFLSNRVAVMSGRPGRIVGEVAVDLPYPRDPDVRFTPEFAQISGQVAHLLRGAHA